MATPVDWEGGEEGGRCGGKGEERECTKVQIEGKEVQNIRRDAETVGKEKGDGDNTASKSSLSATQKAAHYSTYKASAQSGCRSTMTSQHVIKYVHLLRTVASISKAKRRLF